MISEVTPRGKEVSTLSRRNSNHIDRGVVLVLQFFIYYGEDDVIHFWNRQQRHYRCGSQGQQQPALLFPFWSQLVKFPATFLLHRPEEEQKRARSLLAEGGSRKRTTCEHHQPTKINQW